MKKSKEATLITDILLPLYNEVLCSHNKMWAELEAGWDTVQWKLQDVHIAYHIKRGMHVCADRGESHKILEMELQDMSK